MTQSLPARFPTRFALLALVGAAAALAHASATTAAIGQAAQDRAEPGGSENPIEVILPPEFQANYFHSLPIAGLFRSPNDLAERMLMNPRMRDTTDHATSGKGMVDPIARSGVVVTRADPPG